MNLALLKLSCIGSSSSSGIGTANLSAMAAAAALQRLASPQGSSAALSRHLLLNTNSATGGCFHSISEAQPAGPASLAAPQAAAPSIPPTAAPPLTWESLGSFQDPSDTPRTPSTVISIKQQFVLPGGFCTKGDFSLLSRGTDGFPAFPEASAAERHGYGLWSSTTLLPRSASAAAAAAGPSAASGGPKHASFLIPVRVAHTAGSPTAPTTTPAASKAATAGGAAAAAEPHRCSSSAAVAPAAVATAEDVDDISGMSAGSISSSSNSSRGAVADEGKLNTDTATHSGGPLQYWHSASGSSPGQYWRISRKKLYREDGTEWPWHCFTPSDTYRSDTGIDLNKHFKARDFGDTFARYLVKSLRVPTDIFFQRRYGCRAMMLETVAAVPGMVAGMLLHLRSLRMLEHSGGWIKALLEEAENERMHLMTFMEVAKPRWYERALIFSVQAVFFTAYTAAYVLSPRIAHRIVGYLEEEAVHSYTEFLKDIDAGKIENVPAPQIAIDYWRLPKDARLRDVVEVVRADEAHHRDVNHFAATIVREGKKLKDHPAPIDYH